MDRLHQLFEKYKSNTCTPEELSELLTHFELEDNQHLLKQEIENTLAQEAANDPSLQADVDEVYSHLQAQLFKVKHRRLNYARLVAAACIIIFCSIGIYFYKVKSTSAPQIAKVENDLVPGKDKAILTLANGQKIDLNDAGQGQISTQGDAVVDKTKDGHLIYESISSGTTAAPIYNTLTTPRGGQYPLTLADGTKVWLDAASSITFPVVFTGNERVVTITGQAYFEVAHNAKMPFKVHANGQLVEVLGTHFNVNAYADEPEMKTTLLEGSVKISNRGESRLLTPGQQSIVASHKKSIDVKAVDVEEAIAWHKGLFKFKDADIQTVMRQLSRWYDVEVSYEGAITKRRFSGEIYRDVNASKIAEILNYKEIHFRISGKKIIVIP